MTEFNLEKAKNGAKLITRSGKKARIVCYDRIDKVKNGTILALICNDKLTWERPVFYLQNGRQVDLEKSLDLFIDE
jgi:hypothetical protein